MLVGCRRFYIRLELDVDKLSFAGADGVDYLLCVFAYAHGRVGLAYLRRMYLGLLLVALWTFVLVRFLLMLSKNASKNNDGAMYSAMVIDSFMVCGAVVSP